MRNLDTNVLVRYLTADDARQAARARRLVEQSRDDQEILFLSTVVLCELVWVLSSSYRQPKSAIVSALDSILDTDSFQVEQELLVRRSLAAYRSGPGSFADYLIGELGRHAGSRDTVTFDRALKGSAGFTLLA